MKCRNPPTPERHHERPRKQEREDRRSREVDHREGCRAGEGRSDGGAEHDDVRFADSGQDGQSTRHRSLHLIRRVALGLALALPVTARAQATVSLLEYKTAVPTGWSSRAPSSSMRL